jgi:drug/metabolite transporter (DMT)-like permease
MPESNKTTQSEDKQIGKNTVLPTGFISFVFVVMVVLFGVRFVAIPFSNSGLGPFWGGSLRLVLAAIVLLFVAVARKPAWPDARGMFFSLIYGFFSVGLNIGLMYWGLLQVSSDIAAIVYATVPLAAIILSICFRLEKYRLRLILGALLGLYGVEVIFGVAMGFGINIVFLVAVIGGALCNAVGMIAAKKAQEVNPILMNGVGFALGASMLLVVSLLTGETIALPSQQVTWLAIGFLVAVSVVGYSLNVYIIQQKSVTYASFSNVLTPLVTIATSSVMFGEAITPAFIVGGGLIFAGLSFSGHLVIKKKVE